MIRGPRLAGTVGMGGDGGDPSVFESTIALTAKVNGAAIPVSSPASSAS